MADITEKKPTRRATITVCYTISNSEDEVDAKEPEDTNSESHEYSISHASESFTFLKPGHRIRLGPLIESANEDTDIEADEELKEYSEVRMAESELDSNTEEKENKMQINKKRTRKSTMIGAKTFLPPSQSAPKSVIQHKCSTSCAHTYNKERERRKRAVSFISGLTSKFSSNETEEKSASKNVCSTSEDTDVSEATEQSTKQRVRKRSKFEVKGFQEEKKDLEGIYKLVGSINFEEFLSAIGTGPLTSDMVMRADMTLTIEQQEDKQWRLCNETLIKAKSSRGYRTNNRKWTENKFKPGEPKPELLDDWDQRLVVTTLEVNPEGTRLTLNQEAEKDQFHKQDSTIILDVDTEEGKDSLVMTYMAGAVIGWRKFQRQVKKVTSNISRKISSPF